MLARISLYLIAAVLIAAHFLRAGNHFMATLCLAAPGLLILRQAWSLLLLEALAYAASCCWLWTAWELVGLRRAEGRAWQLAAAILSTAAALSALAGILLRKIPASPRGQRSGTNDGSQITTGERQRQ